MSKRLRDKKITIYKRKTIDDGSLMPDVVYDPIHPGKIWAYVRQVSDEEIFKAGGDYSRKSMLFEIAWRDDVKPEGYFVEYKGTFYNVKKMDTFEGYKDTIKLIGDSFISQPKASEILEYNK